MTGDDDNWFSRGRESRREYAERLIGGLNLSQPEEPAEVTARKERETRERMARHDALFSADYLAIKGAPVPISKDLAAQLGYDVQHPRWTAGGDPDDGEVADPGDEG